MNDIARVETEKKLHKYGCALAGRGLSKDDLGVLMRSSNAKSDAPLDDDKLVDLIEGAFVFALRDDVDVNLPTIVGTQRQLVPLLREIYDSLQPDVTLYRHGGGLVSLRDGKMSHYTAESMPKLLSSRANYVNGKTNDSMFPPAVAAKAVLYSLDDENKIRPLKRVANVPVLRPDGTVFDSPGYDVASELYYHPTGDVPKIPPNPTQEHAVRAGAWLLDMISQFPFEGESDRTNYIGLLLTLVVRELVGCVPLALIDAPSAGTGKSLLAKIAAIIATGALPEFGVLSRDEDELRKAFTSRLMEGPSILIFDNAADIVKSSTLAAVITSDVWQDRPLRKSVILHLPMRAVLIVTGNNIRLGGDMPRRCYRIRIDSNAAQPWRRDGFKHQLPEYAMGNRGKIVAALLTMARAWIVAGLPDGDNPILGSFESWCRVVGGILRYAGLTGFLGNLAEMHRDTADGEDDAEQWADWVSEIRAHFGDSAFTVKCLAEAMSGTHAMSLRDDAPYSLGEIGLVNDRAWLTRLGSALHSRRGQVFKLEHCSVKLCQGILDRRSGKKQYWLSEVD
jgi:hypothetical protein